MARSAEIFCFCVIVHTSHRRNGTLCGRNARRSRNVVDGHRKCRFMVVGVMLHHLRKLQLLDESLGHRHTDQTFAVGRHKVDVFGGGKFGSTDEVPLVFTVGVIRYQNDFSLFQVLQSFGNGIEVHRKLSLKAAAQQHFFCERVLLWCF